MSAYRLQTLFLVAMLFATFVGSQPVVAQSFTFFAGQTAGIGSADVRIEVVNAAETTGDNYRVTFSQQGSQFFYSIENTTTQAAVVNNLPTEQPSQVFDGIMVFVQLPTGSEIRDIIEVEYGGNPVDPAVHVFRPGDLQGEGGSNSTAEYTFVGGGHVGDFSSIARRQENMNSFDYEIRFDGNPDGRNKLIHAFTGQGTTDVPFSVWNIGIATPDDPTDDRQVIAVGFDDSGNPAVYDGGATPVDGGPGTMFDRIYIFEINQNGLGDINGDGKVDYDDVLQDITNNGGDISTFFFGTPYRGPEVLSNFSMVALNGDASYLPPAGTTIRITSTKSLTESDVYEFATPSFGLYTETVSMRFGNVRVEEQYTQPLTLKNGSSVDIVVSDITSDNPAFQAVTTSLALAAGQSAVVDIIFSPSDSGEVTGTLAIASNDQFFPTYNIAMTGEGLPVREGAINIIGRVDIPGGASDIWGYFDEANQREYALLGGLGNIGVTIVDVTEPARGKIVAQIHGVPGFDVKAWDHFVYSVTGGSGAGAGKIIDIADPADPQIVGSFDSSHNIFITDDGYMILEIPGLRVLDLNPDPINPNLLWTGGVEGHDASVINNVLYDFHGTAGTFIYDFTDPANPALISAINDPGIAYSHSGWPSADGNYLFICDELSQDPSPDIVVYDISDLSNPQRAGGFGDPDAIVHNLFVMGNYAVTSYYTAGFRVFDVSDPANPVIVDEFDTSLSSGAGFGGAWGVYPFAPSGLIYISDTETGLHLFELRDIADSVTGDDGQQPESFALFENYPNPFNPETMISYQLAAQTHVKLNVYNSLGQRVRTLVDEDKAPGSYQITWDGSNDAGTKVATGIFFYSLKTDDFSATKRMFLLK